MSSGEDSIEEEAAEADELQALARALTLAEGFKLFLVSYQRESHRQRLCAALRAALPMMRIREVRLRAEDTHLLDTLRAEADKDPADCIFVSGFDQALPDPKSAADSPLVANLNAARDHFPHVIPCPLVLWLPSYLFGAIARGAPDFFSVRSGAYLFTEPAAELVEIGDALAALAAGQPRPGWDEHEVLRWLGAYLERPAAEQEPEAAAALFARMGRHMHEQGRLREAIFCDQGALQLQGDLAPPAWRAEVLLRLADARRHLGDTTLARLAYEQAEAAARQAGDTTRETMALLGGGDVDALRGDRASAIRTYRAALNRVGDEQPDLTRQIAERLAEAAGGRPRSILFIGASPRDAGNLIEVDAEVRTLQEAIGRVHARVNLHIVLAARRSDLIQSLQRYVPDVLHFSGHGAKDGSLVLEKEERRSGQFLTASALAGIFEHLGKRLRCVVLNSSYSAPTAQAILSHIKYAIGIEGEVGEAAAIQFSAGFYTYLCAGESIAEAFEMGQNLILLMGKDAKYHLYSQPGCDPHTARLL